MEQLLTESNLTLISFKKVNDSLFGSGMFDRITSKDLVSFFIHLEQLEKAGVPLLDSLSDLKDFSDNQKIREVATDLYESVKSGKLLSEAMEKHKKIFDPVMISLVRMGEKTGGLQLKEKPLKLLDILYLVCLFYLLLQRLCLNLLFLRLWALL